MEPKDKKIKVYRLLNPSKSVSAKDDFVAAYDLDQAKQLARQFRVNPEYIQSTVWEVEDTRRWWRYLKKHNQPHFIEQLDV